MSDERLQADSVRLARLETEVEGMRSQFAGRFNSIESKIDTLSTALSEARKPRWDTWAAWVIVGMTIVGGGAWLIDKRFSDSEARSERNFDQIATNAKNIATIHEKLGEVETQFRTGSQIYNQADFRHELLIDQMWRKQFGQPLRDDVPWPILGKDQQ